MIIPVIIGGVLALVAFVVVFVATAAALAWWTDARLGPHAPQEIGPCLLHVAAALVANVVVAPIAGDWVIAAGAPEGRLIAIMAIVFPALTYAFLAFVWVLRVARPLLPGVHR